MGRTPGGEIRRLRGRCGGFTLIEVLVVVAILLMTGAALGPGLLRYLQDGRASAAAAQLDGVARSVQRFRLDVGTTPESLVQLVDRPGTLGASEFDIEEDPIHPAAGRGWRGPYLDVGTIDEAGLRLPGSGRLLPAFEVRSWGGDRFLAFRVAGVDRAEAIRISAAVDRDTLLAPGDDGAGRVRWAPAAAAGELIYLAEPLP